MHQHVPRLMVDFVNSSKKLISLCFNEHNKHDKIKIKLFSEI